MYLLAGLAFAAGLGVYWARQTGLFLPAPVIGSGPAFFHMLAFSVLICTVETRPWRSAWLVCLAVLICLCFEWSQAALTEQDLRGWVPGIVRNYALRGVFDPVDLWLTAMGGAVGWLITYFALTPSCQEELS